MKNTSRLFVLAACALSLSSANAQNPANESTETSSGTMAKPDWQCCTDAYQILWSDYCATRKPMFRHLMDDSCGRCGQSCCDCDSMSYGAAGTIHGWSPVRGHSVGYRIGLPWSVRGVFRRGSPCSCSVCCDAISDGHGVMEDMIEKDSDADGKQAASGDVTSVVEEVEDVERSEEPAHFESKTATGKVLATVTGIEEDAPEPAESDIKSQGASSSSVNVEIRVKGTERIPRNIIPNSDVQEIDEIPGEAMQVSYSRFFR